MKMEYKVKLPDHSFAAASGHKLTPSVYGVCTIKSNKFGEAAAVAWTGPT